MNFKEKLKDHFNHFDASPVLFIGSGMSRRYLGLENWPDLLKRFADKINANHIQLGSQSNGSLPEYASLLGNIYNTKWWDLPETQDIQKSFSNHLINQSSPLKVEISRYLIDAHKQGISPSLLREIDMLKNANIDGVITTNWDLFLENLFPEFTTFIGQNGLITGRSHGIAEIYKIHGCATEPNSIVLTTDDYDLYRLKNPYLSSKLLTILIERPVIFLGYSLSDEHIAEILEDIVNCFPDKSMDFLKNRLLFVEWKPELEQPEISDSIIHKKIPVKLIQTPNYIDVFSVLSEGKRRIPAHLFRTIKDELYELVLTDDPKGQLYVRDASEIGNEGAPTEYVVGYGAISKIKKAESLPNQGLIGISRLDIIREVIFKQGKYNHKDVVNDVFPSLCKGNAKIPIFYFLNTSNLIEKDGSLNNDIELCEGGKSRFDVTIDNFRSTGGEEKRAKKTEGINISVNELYSKNDFSVFKRMLPYMNENIINRDLDDLERILKKHVDSELGNRPSEFVRVVCVYDYIKYSNRY